ncbi:MAG: F0F1 ATP synthase subunit B [Planctomycetota bacterium]|nr:F0F1 ATP synthase subunit B [Planctomycetota bacterium]
MLSYTIDTTALSQVVAVALPGDDKHLGLLLEPAPGAVIWTLIAFFLALPIMWKMVYGPITRALEDRDQKVEDSIAAAEVARKEAEEQMAAAKAELEGARAESKRMVEEAVSRAERQAAEAQRVADERAKAELTKAREAIAAEKRQALQEIRKEMVGLTIAATGHLLQRDVDDEAHRKMVSEFVGSAAGAEGAGKS